eukprot:3778415-Prymnesium_polylepis.1
MVKSYDGPKLGHARSRHTVSRRIAASTLDVGYHRSRNAPPSHTHSHSVCAHSLCAHHSQPLKFTCAPSSCQSVRGPAYPEPTPRSHR